MNILRMVRTKYFHRKEMSYVQVAVGRLYISIKIQPVPRKYVDYEIEIALGLRSKGAELRNE